MTGGLLCKCWTPAAPWRLPGKAPHCLICQASNGKAGDLLRTPLMVRLPVRWPTVATD
ncbi:hypothetical protein [Candidatus Amarolinea dominans]|uniref:hypothetical protein n=1 Tax=Candidatus Amarolinea dominans TaxID=3140696 RepID=UPI001E10099F|nr:hypothetical protein [Anaerolineae bacterium]